ncbi:DUF1320 domain-containing protein [Xanthomonas sp. CFBP 8445]|uniref:gp436 family protein n=1 Tax=Xanthomonas sp. CFBP 8445 TaxID=2971236 RepID=UPI0021E0D385|nr:DUF1320 domain-containing protein [Xanthomonas sp. CFBP 8445]UYC12285.1 DUF1320 domain-containing protein [Xanthomonas sp. CFBP 8445]
MSYVTLAQLAEIPGAVELAQVASDDQRAPVTADLMALTLRAGDRSSYSADAIAQADAAAARIVSAIAQADSLINGYLGRRYTLPLAKVHPMLATWSRAITRYTLHGDRISDERTDPIARDYRDALRFLEQIAAGKFSLGLDDPTTGSGALGDVLINPGHKVFGRDFLP